MKSAIASLLFLTQQSLSSGGGWNYDHYGADWSHDYSMCDNNDESPIDINTHEAIHDDHVCTKDFEWEVDTTKQTFQIVNNGHSISLKAIEETNIDPDKELSGTLFDTEGTEYLSLNLNDNTIAKFPNYFQPEHSEHSAFCLDSFHFHWGTSDRYGSEHLVDGHQYALEVHFVHYSCYHSSLGTTLSHFPDEANVTHKMEAGEDTHQLGVVGIFFDVREDENNPAFDAIFEHLEEFSHPDEEGETSAHIVHHLDLNELIPEDLNTAGYYAYEGSLTTPPCTNIVRWHVMNARGWIGKEQMESFREIMMSEGHQIAPNYREIQENVNDVYACMDEESDVEERDATTRAVVWAVAVCSIIMAFALGAYNIYANKKEKRLAAESANANKDKDTKH